MTSMHELIMNEAYAHSRPQVVNYLHQVHVYLCISHDQNLLKLISGSDFLFNRVITRST